MKTPFLINRDTLRQLFMMMSTALPSIKKDWSQGTHNVLSSFQLFFFSDNETPKCLFYPILLFYNI